MTPEQTDKLVAVLENFAVDTLFHHHGDLATAHERVAAALEDIGRALNNVADSIRGR